MSKSSKSTSCVKNYIPFTFQLGCFYILHVTVLFLTVCSQPSLARSRHHWNSSHNTKVAMESSDEMLDKFNVAGLKNHFDRNSKIGWGGWTPPPAVLADWQQWLTTWEKKTNNSDFLQPGPENNKIKEERKGSGYPDDWLDLGEGIGGVPPPPWSYKPKNIGKPEACLQPVRRGTCTQKHNRWGYNPYTNKCAVFIYSGCNGNLNNFMNQLSCEDTCLPVPTTGCENDAMISFGDLG